MITDDLLKTIGAVEVPVPDGVVKRWKLTWNEDTQKKRSHKCQSHFDS